MQAKQTAKSKWEQRVSADCDKDKAVKNRNILVYVIVAGIVLSASLCGGQAPKSAAVHRTAQQWAAYYSSTGIISTATYWRLSHIADRSFRARTISDSDLKWELSLLHTKPVIDSPSNESVLHTVVFLFLSGQPPLTPPQENKFFAAFVPYASDKNPQLRVMAAVAFSEIHDVRALPYLQKMQNDSSLRVRRDAAWAVRGLQNRT